MSAQAEHVLLDVSHAGKNVLLADVVLVPQNSDPDEYRRAFRRAYWFGSRRPEGVPQYHLVPLSVARELRAAGARGDGSAEADPERG